jgi:hypothetical protein
MIYTICCHPRQVPHVVHSKVYIAPQDPDPRYRNSHFAWRLTFYALMLVCRRIRAEFRPMFMLATPMWLSYRHVPEYLSDFHGNSTVASANITIDLFALCLQTTPKDPDILPLLRQLSAYRGLYVRFDTLAQRRKGASLFGLSPLLNLCLEKIHMAEWRQTVDERLSRIVVRKSTKRVVVYVKQEKYHWMKVSKGVLLRRLGLDEQNNWWAIVKYELKVVAVKESLDAF